MSTLIAGYDINQFAWSVATKRTQDEIAEDIDAPQIGQVKGARKAAVPADLEPMLATAVTKIRHPGRTGFTKSNGTAFARSV